MQAYGIPGTVPFFAPELWRRQPMGPAADVFAFALLLNQTVGLTGYPWRGCRGPKGEDADTWSGTPISSPCMTRPYLFSFVTFWWFGGRVEASTPRNCLHQFFAGVVFFFRRRCLPFLSHPTLFFWFWR